MQCMMPLGKAASQNGVMLSSFVSFRKILMRKSKCSILLAGNEVNIRKLSELAEIKNEKCVIIGTLFKHQELKPSILKEISDEHKLLPQPKMSNYMSPSDQLILEDEIQRIRLIAHIDVEKLVTGIVIAVKGIENEDGNFEVEDYTFGSLDVGIERPINCVNDR